MWENVNCYNYNNQNCSNKNCFGEEESEQNQMACCKKIREDICCYYPTFWQIENNRKENCCNQNSNYENINCNCKLKENCFNDYNNDSYNQTSEENFRRCNCSKNKVCYEQTEKCNKPKRRCCFCDLFNCICGRR